MSLGLRCPTCQKRMSVPEKSVGRRVQCPRCEAIFRYTGQKEITLGRVRGSGTDVGAALNGTDIDLEMFRSTPVEMDLPEVSEAEIEALFQEAESNDANKRPEIMAPIQDSLPSLDVGTAQAAAMSGAELTEILDGDVVDDELSGDFQEVVEDAALEAIDEAVIEDDLELVEVLPEDLDTPDAEGAIGFDTLPMASRTPLAASSRHNPVLLAKPVVGAAPVAGMPVAGIPRAYLPTGTAPATAALPVTKEPIPPPTPPTKTPLDDVDLDAILEDALDDAPHGGAADTPPMQNAGADTGFAPVLGPNKTPDDEDELDLMSLFEDDDPAELAGINDGEVVEVVDDEEFLFDTKPPTESRTKS